MPTLNWIGKDKVINHHMDVPYKILEHSYGFDNGKQSKSETNSGNKIIHGDNLEALKSLLPEYEGKVKCIYIDPPYNTGNENWVYNDNVNDPKIKKWLGKVVGKEAEDLSRHDKWLCMMYPRLKLLHKLLAKGGAIFISIDDNEAFYLKILLDEIFGTSGYKANFIWKSRQIVDSRNQSMISKDHEYIYVYGKSSDFSLRGKISDKSKYTNPDNDPRGSWMSNSILGLANAEQRPNLHYDLVDIETGNVYPCPPNTGWRYSKETMKSKLEENRIFFPSKKNGRPREKKFLNELASDYTGFSTILNEKVGYTLNGTRTVRDIIPDSQFAFPKSYELVLTLIEQATSKNSIVLDSFAGSGTTAHAVLNLNKQDGGSRKFILVEMENYAENITAERVKRVIKGYGEEKKAVEGTGGSFDYYELGKPLFLENQMLNEDVGLDKIREYVWFSETRQSFVENKTSEEHLLGEINNTAYYFYYFKDKMTTLDDRFLRNIKTKSEQYIIYADNCLLEEGLMQKYHIIFKKNAVGT
ncbi:MAG: type III restriction endonuclease subunit M [Bacteroidetes bacterium 4572_117]|nr:MAG: type III restriction endonuclease subunit M [Bacteroidetes bacterium 4572_117]